MKAHLGTTVFEVTQEQLNKLNEIAEKVYMETSDRQKGLQAAIDYCKSEGCKIVSQQKVMLSKSGEAGQAINWSDLESVIEKVMEKILDKKTKGEKSPE